MQIKKDILLYSVLNAVLTALYIAFVAWFMEYVSDHAFRYLNNEFIGISLLLMILVFSAAIVGTLIFGRPVMWYLNGNKKDAVYLLASTLLALFVIIVVVFVVILSAGNGSSDYPVYY
jgi:hypothetical protein